MRRTWTRWGAVAVAAVGVAAAVAAAGRRRAAAAVLVLSLERHRHRRERLRAQAAGLTFVTAVDGRHLTETLPGLTRGEQACLYGHVGMWLRISAGAAGGGAAGGGAAGGEPVLVLEDDADVRLPADWGRVRAALPPAGTWDVVYLGYNNRPRLAGPPAAGGARRVAEGSDVWGTHALMLTPGAAAKLLDAYAETEGRDPAGIEGPGPAGGEGKGLPVDVWMSRVPGLRRWCAVPSLVRPFDVDDSETQRVR
jgi:hypothetical protein